MNNNTGADDLAMRILAGDQAAERALLEKYFQPMLSLLKFRCHDPAVADDLCQETFRIVIEQLRATPLDNPASLGGYIRKIAMNLFFSEVRTYKQRQTSTDLESIDRQIAEQHSAYDLVRQQQSQLAVTSILESLQAPRDRQILRLFYLAELDKKEICARMQLSPSQFDQVLFRAKQRLRKQFQKNIGKQ